MRATWRRPRATSPRTRTRTRATARRPHPHPHPHPHLHPRSVQGSVRLHRLEHRRRARQTAVMTMAHHCMRQHRRGQGGGPSRQPRGPHSASQQPSQRPCRSVSDGSDLYTLHEYESCVCVCVCVLLYEICTLRSGWGLLGSSSQPIFGRFLHFGAKNAKFSSRGSAPHPAGAASPRPQAGAPPQTPS